MLLFAGLLILLPFFYRADRRTAIIGGEVLLAGAYSDYTNSGAVSSGDNYQVWLSSNTATIGGTQYQCFLELRSDRFGKDGTLAMTTNRAVIWLGRDGTTKFIHPGILLRCLDTEREARD